MVQLKGERFKLFHSNGKLELYHLLYDDRCRYHVEDHIQLVLFFI